MTDSSLTPQLHMRRPDLRDLPPIVLPAGHGLRSFRAGDDAHWTRIIAESFRRPPEEFTFQKVMAADPACRPERIFFITCNDEPVGTASAWHVPDKSPDAGTVHYLGVSPGHKGKRLGYWVTLAALQQMAREGRTWAWLSTDDFRLPAIKTYLNLGFLPLLVHENQRERWANVFAALGQPGLADTFAELLRGPLWAWPPAGSLER